MLVFLNIHINLVKQNQKHTRTQRRERQSTSSYNSDLSLRFQLNGEICRWKTRWNMSEVKPNTLLWNSSSHKYWAVSFRCNYSTDSSYNDCINLNSRTIFYCNEPYIKTYVMSTMTTGRLSALATLHIYREIEIDRQQVSIFVCKKTRKLDLKKDSRLTISIVFCSDCRTRLGHPVPAELLLAEDCRTRLGRPVPADMIYCGKYIYIYI